jgi:hypothetical protein
MRMTVDRSALRIVFYLKLFGVIQINTSGFVRRTAAVSTIGLTDMAHVALLLGFGICGLCQIHRDSGDYSGSIEDLFED